MKLFHTSDWHLGRMLYGRSLLAVSYTHLDVYKRQVSVAAGEGLKGLFLDLGCSTVVSGGQTMNPSTEDILEAVLATPAKKVFVLPNNKNIILAAEQTIPLATDREVVVIPTKTIPQGLSAMLAFDPDADAEVNREAMLLSLIHISSSYKPSVFSINVVSSRQLLNSSSS